MDTATSAPTKTRTEIRDAKTGRTLATVDAYYGPAEVIIRRLGWRRLEDAANAKEREAIGHVRTLGGADIVTEFQKVLDAQKPKRQDGDETAARAGADVVAEARAAAAAAKKANPLTQYDAGELCRVGIDTIDGQPKTPEAIDEFEPEVLTAIATAILRLARPGLFETEAQAKND